MTLVATLLDADHNVKAFVELPNLPDAPVLIVTSKVDAPADTIDAWRLAMAGSDKVDAVELTPKGLDAAPVKG